MCGLKGSRVEAELGEEIGEAGKGWVGYRDGMQMKAVLITSQRI